MAKKVRTVVGVLGPRFAELLQKSGLTVTDVARKAGLSRNTIAKLTGGETVNMHADSARRIARALGVSTDDLAPHRTTPLRPVNPAVGFLRLRDVPEVLSSEIAFQDYTFDALNQPIAHIWYDVRTDALALHLQKEPESHLALLQADFESVHGTMNPNVGFHPMRHVPRQLNGSDQNAIGFAAKVLAGDNVAIAIRIVDRKGREWLTAHESLQFDMMRVSQFGLSKDHWRACTIDLRSPAIIHNRWNIEWTPVTDRGRTFSPDVSVINRIVVEFGGGAPTIRPAQGNGSVLLSPILLGSAADIEDRVLALVGERRANYAGRGRSKRN